MNCNICLEETNVINIKCCKDKQVCENCISQLELQRDIKCPFCKQDFLY